MENENSNLLAPRSDGRIKTYVLMGDDIPYDFLGGNRKIIQRQKGQPIEQAIAQIKGPANIILDAHGDLDGRFVWKNGEKLPYKHLFDKLPKDGILSLTITSCFGGLAQQKNFLKAAPPGMLVITLAGPSTVEWGMRTAPFAIETSGLSNPVDIYIEALDNLPLDALSRLSTYFGYSKPEASIPTIIGIGGNPSQIIDLTKRVNDTKKLDDPKALTRAVSRVQSLFDTYHAHYAEEIRQGNRKGWKFEGKTLGPEEEEKLDKKIADVAEKLAQGKKPKTLEEKRISYALMAAYIEESGELKRIVLQQPNYKAPDLVRRDAYGAPLDPNAPPLRSTGFLAEIANWNRKSTEQSNKKKGVTKEEQAYMDSVEKKLTESGISPSQIDVIVKELTTRFAQSVTNDTLDQNFAKFLVQFHVSTKGWER